MKIIVEMESYDNNNKKNNSYDLRRHIYMTFSSILFPISLQFSEFSS